MIGRVAERSPGAGDSYDCEVAIPIADPRRSRMRAIVWFLDRASRPRVRMALWTGVGVGYATTGDGHASHELLTDAHEAMYAAQRPRSGRDAGAGAGRAPTRRGYDRPRHHMIRRTDGRAGAGSAI